MRSLWVIDQPTTRSFDLPFNHALSNWVVIQIHKVPGIKPENDHRF